MRRLHLIELEDQPWCPRPIRDGATDYLRFLIDKARPYDAIAEHLRAALRRTGARRIVDLCSGAGGPWPTLLECLSDERGVAPELMLTDRYPNLPAFRHIEAGTGGRVTHEPEPVDAAAVPERLDGFRTLFTSFHHFRPDAALGILQDAVAKRQGIGVFEVTERRAAPMAGMLFLPFIIWVSTPFMRPLSWSRMLLTYPLPAIPLVGLVDGIVSCLRTYTPTELEAMTRKLRGFDWEIGQEPVKRSAARATYLIGTPRRS